MSDQKDFTSGENVSIWLKDCNIPAFPKLINNEDADVAIVGAGIAGLMTGYLLILEGKKVVIVDDGEILSGETGRTTSHLMSYFDDRFFNLKHFHGVDNSKLVYQSLIEAIDILEQIVIKEKIKCDFFRLPGFLFLSDTDKVKNPDLLNKEYEASKLIGVSDVEFVDTFPRNEYEEKILPSNFDLKKVTGGERALMYKNQAQFHPLKFLTRLASIIVEKGGKIFTYTHIKEVQGGENARILAENGCYVTCKNVVMATNVPVNDRFSFYTKMEADRTYVVTAKVPKDSVGFGLYWDTEDPYHYVRLERNLDNQSNFDYLIIGGEDHQVGKETAGHEEIYFRLEKWAEKHFPMIQEFTGKWSGQVQEPIDGLPYIGHNPSDYNNVFVCTGDSGQGMTFFVIGAKLLTDLILGRKNNLSEIYSPNRVSMKPSAIKEFLSHNISSISSYGRFLKKSDISDIEDLPNGCGAVITKGFSKVACYRDVDGTLYEFSAICPHLKAVVKWNDDEKSFDCPAHGSRFSKYGKVQCGPAICDLEKITHKP